MTGIIDGQVFRDHKGRRCVALNCSSDHSLVLGDGGAQVFTLDTGDTNSALARDPGQQKVRTMATPYERNPGGSGVLPALQPVWFEGVVTIGKTNRRMGPAVAGEWFWFLLAQIQRINDPGDAATSPPVALQIEVDPATEMEYFRVAIAREGVAGSIPLPGLRLAVPRGPRIRYRIEYVDAKGGQNGRVRVIITIGDMRPVVLCDYTGPTGFDDVGGLYAGWGIYARDPKGGWRPQQLPLVLTFTELDWGF